MNQKTFFLSMAGLICLSFFAFTSVLETQKVDTKQSIINWTGYKVTGKHQGTVRLKSGDLKFDGSRLTGGSFDIDMTSIAATDLEGESKGKLEGHLKSDDFFGTAKYPTAKFKITKAVPQGNNLYKVSGNLTLKGVTKPVKFNATVADANSSKTAMATIKIDRSDYNIKYGSGSFFDNLGDKTIYDEFDLEVKLVTTK